MKDENPTYQEVVNFLQSKLDDVTKDVARTSINDPRFPKIAVRHDVLSELLYEIPNCQKS